VDRRKRPAPAQLIIQNKSFYFYRIIYWAGAVCLFLVYFSFFLFFLFSGPFSYFSSVELLCNEKKEKEMAGERRKKRRKSKQKITTRSQPIRHDLICFVFLI